MLFVIITTEVVIAVGVAFLSTITAVVIDVGRIHCLFSYTHYN